MMQIVLFTREWEMIHLMRWRKCWLWKKKCYCLLRRSSSWIIFAHRAMFAVFKFSARVLYDDHHRCCRSWWNGFVSCNNLSISSGSAHCLSSRHPRSQLSSMTTKTRRCSLQPSSHHHNVVKFKLFFETF